MMLKNAAAHQNPKWKCKDFDHLAKAAAGASNHPHKKIMWEDQAWLAGTKRAGCCLVWHVL